jgi:energy-coupling factor transporter ATP-binding protein EcfA2
MKLQRLQVTNYRSLFEEQFDLPLGGGMNSIIGPNNCGKSNVLRALALALDPSFPFDRGVDMPPSSGPNTRTRVVCSFRLGDSFPERTLRGRVSAAERALSGYSTSFADEGMIRFAVSCSGTRRTEFFQAKGAIFRQPKTDEQRETTRRAVAQFRSLCRFVYVESGDSLERLLRGRFREVLRTVLEEHQRQQYERAAVARTSYMGALRDELLRGLETEIVSPLAQLVPELTVVDLEPRVSSLEQSLLDVDVQLEDSVKGGLASKGTGVRGGVLVGILRYLAEHGLRSVVFAVEEPESFLHPAAQEVLRGDLENLAGQSAVTLIVTTHSPFIPSRRGDSRLFALTKRVSGSTGLSGWVPGDSDRTSLLLSLFRSAAQPDLLERAARSDARAVLIVEGWTDSKYLVLVCGLLGRSALLEGVQIVDAHGARDAVRKAIVFRDELPNVPLKVILDDDSDGHRAYEKLTGTFNFQGTREVLYYSAILQNRLSDQVVEAEDLFDTQLIETFIEVVGPSSWTAQSKRKATWGPGWENEVHYDLTEEAKSRLPEWLSEHCTAADVHRWDVFLDALERVLS